MTLSSAQLSAVAEVDARMLELSEWCATLFEFAEPAWREYRSAAWYIERLRAEGFSVEECSAGMPTAFCARLSNGSGPTDRCSIMNHPFASTGQNTLLQHGAMTGV